MGRGALNRPPRARYILALKKPQGFGRPTSPRGPPRPRGAPTAPTERSPRAQRQPRRTSWAAAEARLLCAAYDRVQTRWPGKCAAIESWLDGIHKLEAQNCQNVDLPVNATGSMLAELFDDHPEGPMSAELRRVGDGLGRFIYFMDAYEDLPADVRKGRYNPLRTLSQQADYEDVCKSSLMLMAADAADAFERLPILLDADILRNILYSGMWSKYAALQKKRNASKEGAE